MQYRTSAISRAKLILRNMIEQRVNEFIADIDLITLTNAAKFEPSANRFQ